MPGSPAHTHACTGLLFRVKTLEFRVHRSEPGQVSRTGSSMRSSHRVVAGHVVPAMSVQNYD